jgi:hypothetical protein
VDLLNVWFQVPLREDADKRFRDREGRPRRASRKQVVGPLHQPFRWRLLEDTLTRTFGGWTREADVEGEWFDDEQGQAVRERSRVYSVDVPDDRLDELVALLRRACVTFVQKCIRLVVAGRTRLIREEKNEESL